MQPRAGATPTVIHATDPAILARWATDAGATQIVSPFVTRGPLRDSLDESIRRCEHGNPVRIFARLGYGNLAPRNRRVFQGEKEYPAHS